MSRNNEVQLKNTLLGKISIGIVVALLVVFINEFVQVIPTHKTKLQGILIFLPIVIAPIGVILGLAPLRKSKDIIAKWGVILNIILFLCPILYMILGTLISGV
jgi:hypothetical protein